MGRPRKEETEEAKTTKKAPEYPDTPSGKALAAVGPDADGEEYLKEKLKVRHGTS